MCRPGALRRSVEGLTTKVLNERLARLVGFGILEKHSFPGRCPHVEYRLTEFGMRFATLVDVIDELERYRRAASG